MAGYNKDDLDGFEEMLEDENPTLPKSMKQRELQEELDEADKWLAQAHGKGTKKSSASRNMQSLSGIDIGKNAEEIAEGLSPEVLEKATKIKEHVADLLSDMQVRTDEITARLKSGQKVTAAEINNVVKLRADALMALQELPEEALKEQSILNRLSPLTSVMASEETKLIRAAKASKANIVKGGVEVVNAEQLLRMMLNSAAKTAPPVGDLPSSFEALKAELDSNTKRISAKAKAIGQRTSGAAGIAEVTELTQLQDRNKALLGKISELSGVTPKQKDTLTGRVVKADASIEKIKGLMQPVEEFKRGPALKTAPGKLESVNVGESRVLKTATSEVADTVVASTDVATGAVTVSDIVEAQAPAEVKPELPTLKPTKVEVGTGLPQAVPEPVAEAIATPAEEVVVAKAGMKSKRLIVRTGSGAKVPTPKAYIDLAAEELSAGGKTAEVAKVYELAEDMHARDLVTKIKAGVPTHKLLNSGRAVSVPAAAVKAAEVAEKPILAASTAAAIGGKTKTAARIGEAIAGRTGRRVALGAGAAAAGVGATTAGKLALRALPVVGEALALYDIGTTAYDLGVGGPDRRNLEIAQMTSNMGTIFDQERIMAEEEGISRMLDSNDRNRELIERETRSKFIENDATLDMLVKGNERRIGTISRSLPPSPQEIMAALGAS